MLIRISAALQDPDPDVCEAAVYVVSYSPSPAYIPLLRHITENDPVQELREDARDMLDAYTEAGIGSAEGGAGAFFDGHGAAPDQLLQIGCDAGDGAVANGPVDIDDRLDSGLG